MTASIQQLPDNADGPAGLAIPDRKILTASEHEALMVFLENFRNNQAAARGLDMECSEEHVFDDFQIDVHLRRVLRGGAPVHLTPREYDLLLALARRDGAPVSGRQDVTTPQH